MTATQEAKSFSLLSLPDELLDRIISTVCSISREEIGPQRWYYNFSHNLFYETPADLRLVCRRFNRIAVVYMFDDLVVWCEREYFQPAEMPKRLHRSCRENPSLWPLCRRLRVYCIGEGAVIPNLYVATDLVTWFTATRSLKLEGLGKQDECWALLRLALKHMTQLSELLVAYDCVYDSYNLCLPRLVETIAKLGSPTLRALEIDGVSRDEENRCRTTLQGRKGTAPLTSLKLRNFLQTPAVLEDLMRWPSKLEEFSLEHTFGDSYAHGGHYHDWSLATFQPLLSMYKSTLRSIKIRAIHKGGLAGFDMRDFVALETLGLSHATTCSRWDGTADEIPLVPKLMAPHLRLFHWDLTLEDQQCSEGLYAFQQPEEDFLRAVAKAAVARGGPLRIDIKFNADPGGSYRFSGLYPWDRMDTLDSEFREHGIRVTYNEPTISREDYLKTLHDTLAEMKLEADSKEQADTTS